MQCNISSFVVLLCISLMISDVEQCLICLSNVYVFSGEMSTQVLCPFLNQMVYFFVVEFPPTFLR